MPRLLGGYGRVDLAMHAVPGGGDEGVDVHVQPHFSSSAAQVFAPL